MLYSILLVIHSLLRWAVIVTALGAIVRGGSGRQSAGKWFTSMLDAQLLIGLVLYVGLSPVTRAAFGDVGAAMANPQLRFFAVEHLFGMLVAIALAHIGRAKVRKAAEYRKARTAMIFYGLALIAILVSIPWPGLPAGRPLFRFWSF